MIWKTPRKLPNQDLLSEWLRGKKNKEKEKIEKEGKEGRGGRGKRQKGGEGRGEIWSIKEQVIIFKSLILIMTVLR